MFNFKQYSLLKRGLVLPLAILNFYLVLTPLRVEAETTRESVNTNQQETQEETPQEQQEDTPTDKESEPLDFSSLGRSGQQTAGESRGGCPQTDIPLTAIANKANISKTLQSHPRWWFYFPFDPAIVSKVEFVVQDEQYNDLIREDITKSAQTSYFSTTIPQENSGLAVNNWYVWYLKVHCQAEEDTVPFYVQGWVQRVESQANAVDLDDLSPLTVMQYIRQDFWLDGIDGLLANKTSSWHHSHWLKTWQKILDSPSVQLKLPLPKDASLRK